MDHMSLFVSNPTPFVLDSTEASDHFSLKGERKDLISSPCAVLDVVKNGQNECPARQSLSIWPHKLGQLDWRTIGVVCAESNGRRRNLTVIDMVRGRPGYHSNPQSHPIHNLLNDRGSLLISQLCQTTGNPALPSALHIF